MGYCLETFLRVRGRGCKGHLVGRDSVQDVAPPNSASVHWCQIEMQRQSFGGVERSSFVTLPGKEGHRLMLSRLCPTSWEAGRGLTVLEWKTEL